MRVGGEGVGEPWFVETPSAGTFELYLQGGTHRIEIHVKEGGSWRHVGWYGEGGFVTDPGRVTMIEVNGTDTSGIEIRLPAAPADIPTVVIPHVQGTVLGPDGEPATGIGLWLWGESTENSKFGGSSSDGTFDLDHQNGTFTLRVYTWKDEVWHQVGWYGGPTGFTTDRTQAAEIEVDGADVTGIEIRLPADFADLPTIFS